MNSWKAFSGSAGCESIFPAKSCWDAWRSGSLLARGQVNMVDEAKLSGPIRSTFEVLVVHLQLDVVVEKNSVDQSQLQVL